MIKDAECLFVYQIGRLLNSRIVGIPLFWGICPTSIAGIVTSPSWQLMQEQNRKFQFPKHNQVQSQHHSNRFTLIPLIERNLATLNFVCSLWNLAHLIHGINVHIDLRYSVYPLKTVPAPEWFPLFWPFSNSTIPLTWIIEPSMDS